MSQNNKIFYYLICKVLLEVGSDEQQTQCGVMASANHRRLSYEESSDSEQENNPTHENRRKRTAILKRPQGRSVTKCCRFPFCQ